ncbi:hypothetical protein MTBBW1_2620016 [Desulfamplus magnetovallimortis]|uniref:Uncharacterized protein n=1 Tax=Desulfamplus magnetovallimortis TaxID=1246637 RepID=A0A1W1HF98_9BACT|nr:hypothetical protein MTBBW1_2620016 [Desulfamplus magnetovallimortis]
MHYSRTDKTDKTHKIFFKIILNGNNITKVNVNDKKKVTPKKTGNDLKILSCMTNLHKTLFFLRKTYFYEHLRLIFLTE